MKVSEEAVARSRRKPEQINPFKVETKLHPKAVSEGATIAMDSAIGGYGEWAAAAISGLLEEGQAFLGYPLLAELAQRPEYRRISETIARHMTRKWIELKAKGDEDKTDKISKLNDAMETLQLKAVFQKCAQDDGFFGRGHLFLDFGDVDNPEELKLNFGDGADATSKAKVAKGSLQAIRAVEAVWVYPTNYNSNDPLKGEWYKPSSWFVMGKQVHSSRLLTFVGREVPDLLKPAYSFGGLSLSQMAKPYVDNWLRTRQSIADIVSAFSTFVLKSNLSDSLMVGGEELFKRAEIFNNVRDNRGLMMIDKQDEEFENVSAPLSSLDQIQAQSQEHMAAVSGIPIVILLGINPAGLNATSEGDIEIFYDWIHSLQEQLFRPNLTKVLNFIQLSVFGEVDPNIVFEFLPLLSMDEGEEADLQNKEAQTDQVYVDMGAIDPAEVRKKLANDPKSPYPGLDPNDLPAPPMPGENDDHDDAGEPSEPREPNLKAA